MRLTARAWRVASTHSCSLALLRCQSSLTRRRAFSSYAPAASAVTGSQGNTDPTNGTAESLGESEAEVKHHYGFLDLGEDFEGAHRLPNPYESNLKSIDQEVAIRAPAKRSGKRCFNRSVLLTGGTSGIGYAIAEQLIREGAGRIVIPTRDADLGLTTLARLKASTGFQDAPVTFLNTNISHPDSYAHSVVRKMDCDTLITSAGIGQYSFLLGSAFQADLKIVNTNLLSPMNTARVFMRHCQRRQARARKAAADGKSEAASTQPPSNCFVAISSLLAIKRGDGASAYAASKAGLIALTRAMTLEATPFNRDTPFRANVVLPGYVNTPMTESKSTHTTSCYKLIEGHEQADNPRQNLPKSIKSTWKTPSL
jgi:NAD(P)-dependent dehydrogenase (short-subunit alcohol dehydrogenase family)